MQAIILYQCLCVHDLHFSTFSELVFFFPHSVFHYNLIFTIEEIWPRRLISEVKTGFLSALHTLSLLAMGGFRLSWEIVEKSRTLGLSGSELSSSRGAGEALCSARSLSKHRPTRSAFTDWAFMARLYG